MTERALCPVCGLEGERRHTQSDLFCGVPGSFGQCLCANCGSYFLSPRVPEAGIDAHYPASYMPYLPPPKGPLDRIASLLGLDGVRRRMVERFVSEGAILDVGAGNGAFLASLDASRWNRFALDVEHYCELPFPHTFATGRFDHAAPDFPPMDAITLWHVFEHFYHPAAALKHAADLLKPGGHLFIAIPDLNCLERRVFGGTWIGWDPPRHIATYSAKAMSMLLAAADLKLIDILADHCNGAMIALNIEFALRSRGVRLNVHNSPILRILCTPAALLCNAMGLAPAKVYVARR